MTNNVMLLLGLIMTTFIGNAQRDILNKYIEEGLENNLSLRAADIDVNIQSSAIEQANKLWAPKVDVNGSYLLATGGRTIVFPVGDLFNPAYATLNQLTGSQQFPTDLENVNTQLTPNNFLDLQINASKPLINSAIKYNQKIQQEILSIQELNKKVTNRDIVFQIKSAYYNYLKSFKGIATIDEGKKTLAEVLRLNQILVKYEKATDDAISDVEYRIANLESQKVGILEQQTLAKALLNLLINRPLESDVEIDTMVTYNPLTQSLDELKRIALQNRTELKQLSLSDGINVLNQERVKKDGSPQVNVFAGVGLQTEEFDFDSGGPLYTTGLSMKVNITDGGLRKKQLEQLQYEREKIDNSRQQLNQKIEIEITQVYYQIKTIESQIESAEISVQSAQKSYDILLSKYENNKVLLIEVLQAQNRLTTSQLNRDILRYDHLIKLAELDKALGNEYLND